MKETSFKGLHTRRSYLCDTLEKAKPVLEIVSVAAWSWDQGLRVDIEGAEGTLGNSENILYLGCGDSYMKMHIC